MYQAPPLPHGDSKKNFHKKTFKLMAAITIVLGIICFTIGISEVIYSVRSLEPCRCWAKLQYHRNNHNYRRQYYNRKCNFNYNDVIYEDPEPEDSHCAQAESGRNRSTNEPKKQRCSDLYSLGISAAALYLICGVLFIITGSLGVGAARTAVSHRRSGLKMGYVALNTLNAIIFGPGLLLGGGAMVLLSSSLVCRKDYWIGHVWMGAPMAIAGLVMTVLAIVVISMACCCAPTIENDIESETMHQMPTITATAPHLRVEGR